MRLRIAELRKSKGWTQGDLAEKIGMSRAFLAHVEVGNRSLTMKKQKLIADALGVDPTELVDFDAPDPNEEQRVVEAFRKASPEQRRAWLDMAKIISGSGQGSE